ncbi:unnamed protein product [Heligmosomoides polygyrus]|uniref:DDE_3 domain-containing protein n=1 Tax=Heligmosomoides polygyrus TaxID=6339 RepID=A0A183FUQ1_HELPZ|nr:unnamed protein product [Heligmosomoides polygyrus]
MEETTLVELDGFDQPSYADLLLDASRTTIRRAARRSGNIIRESTKRAPRLTDRHKAKLLQFARRNIRTHILEHGSLLRRKEVQFGRPRWISLLLAVLQKNPLVFGRRNFGGGSQMVWGAFCSSGIIYFYFLADIVRRIHFYAGQYMPVDQPLWLNSKNWPAGSPDLNPIENLWEIIVRQIYSNGKQLNNVEELKLRVIVEPCGPL